MAKLSDLHNAIVKGNLELAVSTTQEALQENIDPQTLISDYLIKGMEEIGTQFEAGKAYVPNLLMSARAMKGALELLKPYMENDKNTISLGKVVIGTVKGDLHDIGKNLVSSMLEGCGFEVINLGVDVSDEKFVEAAKGHKANIVCMSALLTTTMVYMKEVIKAFEKAGIRNDVKIMIGGAPLSEKFAEEIGADGYSDNANAAVTLARKLLNK
ncbi:corrinoid protein [Barnesiella intestinihominis]|uniref:corrinoid protein n=1 Tax=Barnesiella intestinihominis TaxID=487174 RepID=UPI00266EB1A6|nr:corrinoid protein [Barnesiella intestinihominis]